MAIPCFCGAIWAKTYAGEGQSEKVGLLHAALAATGHLLAQARPTILNTTFVWRATSMCCWVRVTRQRMKFLLARGRSRWLCDKERITEADLPDVTAVLKNTLKWYHIQIWYLWFDSWSSYWSDSWSNFGSDSWSDPWSGINIILGLISDLTFFSDPYLVPDMTSMSQEMKR